MKKLWLLPIVILVAVSVYLWNQTPSDVFVVGILDSHRKELPDLRVFEQALGLPVELRVYHSEAEMLPDLAADEIDLYAASTFFYLEMGPWENDKAFGSLKTEYSLIGREDSPTSGNLVIGVYDSPVATLLLSAANPLYGSVIEYRHLRTNEERIAALDENQCDYVVFRGDDSVRLQMAPNRPVMTRLSDLGYSADLWILNARRHNDSTRKAIASAFPGLAEPSEKETMQVMSFLFQEKKIPRRIAFYEIMLPQD